MKHTLITATAISLCCLTISPSLRAQIPQKTHEVSTWEEVMEQSGEQEDWEAEDWEQHYETLSEWAEHKLDLNHCTREELEQLPFLSAQQVMDLMEYRDRARRVESPMELRMVPSLEKRHIDLLMQFAEIRQEVMRDTVPSLNRLLKYSRHELMATFRLPLYTRKGDEDGYLGYKYKHWLRYTFTATQHVRAGFLASQDAGEPFFAGRNSAGYDFYSAYVMLRNMGRLKALVLGRYRLRFGMGLVMNNSFGLGKLATLATLGNATSYIVPHSSRMEGYFMQGAATTVSLTRGLDLTAFASWRKIDATLSADSNDVVTLLRTGYHRTPSEMNRRRNTSQTAVGTHLGYFHNGWHAGLTAYYTAFDRTLKPDTSYIYRRWYPEGKQFWNVSVDYGYISGRFNFSGETATGDGGSVATVNSMSYIFSSAFSLMALQRYYPYQYHSLFARSFTDGTQTTNESGVYVGAKWLPWSSLEIMAYVDIAYHAWPMYRAMGSSHSFDHFVQAQYSRGPWLWTARYRLRRRQLNDADKSSLTWRNEHRGRVAVTHQNETWRWRTQADMSLCNQSATSRGYMLSQYAGWKSRWLRVQATAAYFHTDDFDSRIYAYEPALLYQLSFPAFSGRGMRFTLNLRTDIGSHLMMCARATHTHYFDRDTIGTGLQAINGRNMTDLEFQVRWKM